MKRITIFLILSLIFATKVSGETRIDLTTAGIESVSSDAFRIHHLTVWGQSSPSYTVDFRFNFETLRFVPVAIAEEPSSLPYPTDSSGVIDLSLTTYYIDNDTVEIGHVTVTGYPGTYNAWLQFDPVNLVFVVYSAKAETFNLPPGFPLNVPGGTYKASGEWCFIIYGTSTCLPISDGGNPNALLKNDDYEGFAWSADPLVSAILKSTCPYNLVAISYEPYVNGSFSGFGTTSCNGISITTKVTFTRVSNIVWYQ